MKTNDSIRSAVTSLQSFLGPSAKDGQAKQTPATVLQKAKAADFPYPELASQVFKFLQTKGGPNAAAPSAEDISDAFMALLMDADSVEALGAGKTRNPWLNVRAALRSTGANIGASLMEVYQNVRKNGLGYSPTLLDLASELRGLMGKAATADGPGDAAALKQAAQQQGLPPWKIALLMAWMARRSKKAGSTSASDIPEDSELEELFSDEEALRELQLQNTDGPWDIYGSQAQALRTLRHFGQGLLELADEVEGK